MSIKEDWLEANSVRFYTKRWQPANEAAAYILFCHGFMEHITRYDSWFSLLADRGYSIFAYDQRGYGRTSAETNTQAMTSTAKMLNDLEYFINRENSLKPEHKKLFLMGHSMGGAEVLNYATHNPPLPGLSSLAGVIASAPLIDQGAPAKASPALVRVGSILGAVLPSLQMSVGVPSKDICRDPEVVEAYAKDPLCPPIGTYKAVADMLLGGPRLISHGYKNWPRDLPLLLYHGTEDKVTSYPASKCFSELVEASDLQFESLEGFYHEPHNEPGDEKLKPLNLVDEWLKKHI